MFWWADDAAAQAATIAVGFAAAYKLWFWGRKDLREDRSGSRQSSGYGALVDELQQEVDRLAKMVRDLSTRLDNEISQRREVETENHDLRLRLAHLEAIAKAQGWTI